MKKTHAGAIDQELSTDITTAESSADVFSNEAIAGQRTARSVRLYFDLIMLCTGRALDRIASAPLGPGHAGRGDFSFRRVLRRTMQDLL